MLGCALKWSLCMRRCAIPAFSFKSYAHHMLILAACLPAAHMVMPPLLCFTGAIYPEEGPLNKPAGRRVAKFGPIKSWSLAPPTSAAAAAGPVIRLTTQVGCYILSRPLPAYKKVWAELLAQATLASEVMQVGLAGGLGAV